MRRSIALVATAGILPIIALGGAFGFATLRAERAAVQNGTDAAARFIATLSSVKLTDGMHEVNMIAQSPAFDGAFDAARFRTLAVRLRATASNWRFLSVADANGRRIVDVPEPIGAEEGGSVVDIASLRQAVATQKPIVGNVLAGPRGGYAFAVRAPVVRDGRVLYVVSAVIPAEAASPLLRFRALPAGWRAGIVDGAGNVVASSVQDPKAIGRSASAAGRLAKQSGKPGLYRIKRDDGDESIAYWRPIPGTTWSSHVSAPAAAYAAAATGAWTLLATAVLICLALLALFIRLAVLEIRQTRTREMAAVQRQRMEALGRLTGGVAHDFNNLLQPVMSGLDLLRRRVGDDEKSHRYIELAMASAERARSLVARLLSFSRQQPLSSAAVDVVAMMGGIKDLLERSLNPNAQVRFDLPAGLPAVQADANQLELAVLNLAINARDAMPHGGTVEITARVMEVTKADDLAPGSYVAISVSDTGTGMDEATTRQAIDPFFTTKSADKGTGLGLSMAHGFAAQSGGALRLSSRLGVGTTATIVMPRASVPERAALAADSGRRAGTARILLVDDDDHVRRSVSEVLRENGHSVTDAASVAAALDALSLQPDFDLVITDFLMPERDGGDLIRSLEQLVPSLPVLLITGYETKTGDVPESVPRLIKPFRADELLARVDVLLAGSKAVSGLIARAKARSQRL